MSWDEVRTTCWKCKTKYVLPRALHDSARASDKISFYCPYGHSAHFKSPEDLSREDQLRQERDRLRQQLAQKDDEIREANKRVSAHKGKVTRLVNRAKAGMCPCCNRHFTNLERHMASKHADEKVEP